MRYETQNFQFCHTVQKERKKERKKERQVELMILRYSFTLKVQLYVNGIGYFDAAQITFMLQEFDKDSANVKFSQRMNVL